MIRNKSAFNFLKLNSLIIFINSTTEPNFCVTIHYSKKQHFFTKTQFFVSFRIKPKKGSRVESSESFPLRPGHIEASWLISLHVSSALKLQGARACIRRKKWENCRVKNKRQQLSRGVTLWAVILNFETDYIIVTIFILYKAKRTGDPTICPNEHILKNRTRRRTGWEEVYGIFLHAKITPNRGYFVESRKLGSRVAKLRLEKTILRRQSTDRNAEIKTKQKNCDNLLHCWNSNFVSLGKPWIS